MRAIRVDLPTELKSIEIVVIADYHYSSPNSDHDAIKRDIEYIKSRDDVYCVLAGDLLECALKTSLGDVYTSASPMEELTAVTELLSPIADKVVGCVPGNHEGRHYKTNGVDMTRLMACQLRFESRYSEDAEVIFLRFGADEDASHRHRPMLYTIYLTHGFGGGRKEGAKLQRLADCAEIADCDVYIVGHTHLPAALKTNFIRPVPTTSSLYYGTHLFVNAAAKLGYGGYGASGGYKPPCIETPRIILDGTKKHMEAVI